MHHTLSFFFHDLMLVVGGYAVWGLCGVGASRLTARLSASMDDKRKELNQLLLSLVWFLIVFPAVFWVIAHVTVT